MVIVIDLSIIDKLILIAKQRLKILVAFFILTLFIAFCPIPISSKIGISSLPKSILIINGIVLVFTATILLANIVEILWKKKINKRDVLNKQQLLNRLENLTDDPCLHPKICFDKNACMSWAHNVEILLKGNSKHYYEWRAHRKTILQTHDLFNGIGYLINRMKNILDL